MLMTTTGAACADGDREIAEPLADLSRLDDKICFAPPREQPKNRLISLAREYAALAAPSARQCADTSPPQAPTEGAPKAAEGGAITSTKHRNEEENQSTKTPTPTKNLARAAGSRSGKRKGGSTPSLTNHTAREIEEALRAVESGQPVTKHLPTVTALADARQSNKPARQPRRADAMIETFWQGRWRDLSPAQKLTCATWRFARAGGHAFSLNLSQDFEDALRSRSDMRERMAQLLRDSLRIAGFGELPIAWVFELNPDAVANFDRLHLHGILGGTADLPQADLDRLKKALCEAAGKATGATGGERQLDLKPLSYAPGWASYMLEGIRMTADRLGLDPQELIYIGQKCVAPAEALFLDMKRDARAKQVANDSQLACG